MDMNVETDDLEVLMSGLEQKIQALGGYVEDQSIHNGSNYSARRYRNANITVRIPDEQVEQFTGDIAGMANVVSQNLRREDITLKYVATASRVTALETEEARLLELLAKAETMADLLEIEARLTDVRYELENYASQLRLYDNQVDYATVYLSISEVQEYTPVEEPTFRCTERPWRQHRRCDGLPHWQLPLSAGLLWCRNCHRPADPPHCKVPDHPEGQIRRTEIACRRVP